MESAATLLRIDEPKLYRTRRPEQSPFYAVLHHYFDRFTREYEHRFERTFGPLRGIVTKTVERFLDCGLPENGFARVRCDACKNEYLVAFSCKQRGFCPSCSAKRATLWADIVREQVIRPVPHRHLVFALPKILRPSFRRRRQLLPKLTLCVWKALSAFLREDTGNDTLPAAIVSIQTAGEFLNWHPHLHVLAPAGAFRTDGSFARSPVFDAAILRDLFQANVLALLRKERMISQELVERMREWRHSGFHAYAGEEIPDIEDALRVGLYMVRGPAATSRLRIDPAQEPKVRYLAKGTVPDHGEEWTSSGHRDYDYLEWIARLTSHIPDRGTHLVHYYGAYSNAHRGVARRREIFLAVPPENEPPDPPQPDSAWLAAR
ncbi:MAG: transposase zinc-binding domain-containing protein, partial [Deltaproteobacteria bacterium]|nr:transposase zinc-binding domain-containing protein [Deltaproteobacteria bacterium]